METKVLKSELAGTWYSDNPKHLAREIDAYLENVGGPPVRHVMALLLPHAGYRYSGRVAAHGIKQIVGHAYSRVIVLGPSHRVAMLDTVSMPDATHIETPLGQIEIDRDMVARLLKNPLFRSLPKVHAGEHSVQIELPFLQQALGTFKLVPIVCGELDEDSARRIAATLLENIDAETLVVVSSDFTHYGRSFDYVPFKDDIKHNLETLDIGAFRFIEKKDLSGFCNYIQKTGATICGRSPIAVLLAMLPSDAQVKMLKYDTSGNLTGDWSHCVSYVSAAVSGLWQKGGVAAERVERGVLSESDKINLLRLARHKIAQRLDEDESELAIEITPPMQQVMGAFVTLHKRGELRGCIGEIFPHRALAEAVAEQSVNAAFHDPRFPRVRPGELAEIDIEISALTEPHRVNSYADIVIGKHGIVLNKKGHSAVFLPQVATEQGWGLEATLSHLALKAGLGANDWKTGCEYRVFEAMVFSEI